MLNHAIDAYNYVHSGAVKAVQWVTDDRVEQDTASVVVDLAVNVLFVVGTGYLGTAGIALRVGTNYALWADFASGNNSNLQGLLINSLVTTIASLDGVTSLFSAPRIDTILNLAGLTPIAVMATGGVLKAKGIA
jgi:hypothetical protein